MIRATIDGMIARRFGRIVNVTSYSVKMPIDVLCLSNGARAGLTGFIAGLARQVAAHNVTINNLLPGVFATARQEAYGERGGEKPQGILLRRSPAAEGGRHSRRPHGRARRVRRPVRLALQRARRLLHRPERAARRRALSGDFLMLTPFARKLGLEVPIFQAPMAGATIPELVLAVGRAGALGGFGFAYTEPAAMKEAVEKVRRAAAVPIHINFFVERPAPAVSKEALAEAVQRVRPFYEALKLPVPEDAAATVLPGPLGAGRDGAVAAAGAPLLPVPSFPARGVSRSVRRGASRSAGRRRRSRKRKRSTRSAPTSSSRRAPKPAATARPSPI